MPDTRAEDRHVTYKRITRRELLDPKIAACWPVGRGDALLGRLWLLLDVDVRVHTLQTVYDADERPLTHLF